MYEDKPHYCSKCRTLGHLVQSCDKDKTVQTHKEQLPISVKTKTKTNIPPQQRWTPRKDKVITHQDEVTMQDTHTLSEPVVQLQPTDHIVEQVGLGLQHNQEIVDLVQEDVSNHQAGSGSQQECLQADTDIAEAAGCDPLDMVDSDLPGHASDTDILNATISTDDQHFQEASDDISRRLNVCNATEGQLDGPATSLTMNDILDCSTKRHRTKKKDMPHHLQQLVLLDQLQAWTSRSFNECHVLECSGHSYLPE